MTRTRDAASSNLADGNVRIMPPIGEVPRRVSILVGGSVTDETRAAIVRGERARIDVVEMERIFGARLFDFDRLNREAATDHRAHVALELAKRTGFWSAMTAVQSFNVVRQDHVIYATGEDVGFALASLFRMRRVTAPRLIVRLEQTDYGRTVLRRSIFSYHRAYAIPRIERIVCRTRALLHTLASIDRVPMEKLAFVRETVDTKFFDPALVSAEQLPGVATSGPFILSAGMEMRDYKTLIEAVRGLDVRVIIAAGSPWSRNRLEWGASHMLPPNVHVDAFPPNQMRALYAHALFVVVPVRPGLRACGMNVVLEGWAMGRAAIATRTTGLLDYIREGETGLLVEPYDVVGLRERIAGLLDNPGEAARLGAQGQRYVREDLNLDRYIARIAAIMDRTPAVEPA